MSESTEISLDQLPWLNKTWRDWVGLAHNDKVPSAILVAGQRGVGKNRLTSEYAKFLLCEQALRLERPCGDCRSCKLIEAGTHPDLQWLAPEDGAKAIKIDQVRGLGDFIYAKPQISRRRICVLTPAEAMNAYSANAILKTLEEPPASAVILLVSQQISLLLPTIRSRCQIYTLAAPDRESVVNWLTQLDVPKERAYSLTESAGGRPLTALAWHSQDILELRAEVLADWLNYLEGRVDAFTLAETWSKLDLERLADWLAIWLKQLLTATQVGEGEGSVTEATLAGVGARLDTQQLVSLYAELIEIKRSLVEQRNLNPQLMLESWLLANKRVRKRKK
ncbi:DNA polymerase III subunit delta' [Hahella sp. NBU794]|uniref:DNA polymerase III subunit delta' n=1 Tax=Hahella sp. NBU794 TaxID=3422590 RepID=UPI003D6E4A2E